MNTAELLDLLSTAVHRDAARRRHRRRVALVAAMLALFVVGGVGIAGTYGDWWTDNAPAVQPARLGEVAKENSSVGIDLDLSKKATVARTDDAALDAVATNGGKGYCMSLFVGAKHMGSSCTTVADSEYRSRADDTHWIGYGRILDDGAAALDLSSVGLSSRVALERGGFFLFDIPRSQWSALNGRSGDISIVDATGNTIRRACIYVGVAPGSPYAGEGGLGDAPGSCANLAPLVPHPEFDRAQKLVTLTLTHPFSIYQPGDTIAVWSMPNRGGGTCTFLASSTATPGPRMGGGGCTSKDEPVAPAALSAGIGSTLVAADDDYTNVVQGTAGAAVAKIGVVGSDRTIAARLGGGAFLAELPPSPRAGKEPGKVPGGPYDVVAYDTAGNEIARIRLREPG